MKKNLLAIILACFLSLYSFAQYRSVLPEKEWVDSVFNSLTPEEKIAQLMIIRAHSNLGPDHVAGVADLIKRYNVGALCFFQGGPVRQANLTNLYQTLAKTPLLVTIDGEYGLGMRLDSVIKFPYQSTLGALTDESLIYKMGIAVGEQMKRLGVQVNYAPSVDVNNNPNNPVIGYRSFGEDKDKVARYGIAYMRGMQDAGIMATAKHFPGHGDTEVDSHLDLPVINKSMKDLDSLELYPFRQLIKAGVGSVMIAHLSVPSIDDKPNRPTSLSKKTVTDLLRKKLDFKGLVFTDALEMKGVTKFYPAGEAAVQALIAGSDMLCLPENVTEAINAVKKAIDKNKLSWNDIDEKVQRVLTAKYKLGLNNVQPIDTTNLVNDLNAKTNNIIRMVARNTLTVLKNSEDLFPFKSYKNKKVAYVGIGTSSLNQFGQRLQQDLNVDTFLLSYNDAPEVADSIVQRVNRGAYNSVIIGIHNYSLRPANNFNISNTALKLWNDLQTDTVATFLFGNVYAAKNFCTAKNLVAVYQDDSLTQQMAADFVLNKFPAKGKLPVSVCGFPFGTGLMVTNLYAVGTSPAWLAIDSIVYNGLARRAFPGCVVLAVQNGKVKYHKSFGHYEFDHASLPVQLQSIYDLASVTKISATTVAVMKLYEEGKLDLEKTLGDYLPWTRGSNKAPLLIKDILLHQAGLSPYISFYRETIDPATGKPSPDLYSTEIKPGFSTPVARDLYIRNDWVDTMQQRIVKSPLGPHGKYVYSDNDFILLGKIVEAITGTTLDKYVRETFYIPLGMNTTGFRAGERFGSERIVPTENEKYFRRQLLRGYVHDEGAAMFGGISGHAGLFSDAYDLSILYQMLLNGGELGGMRFLKPETINYFTAYHSDISRRGYGFDKPEKDNATRKEPYPSALASPETYGHTGFTGTCVWVDPASNLVYIFLSNRVYNTRDNNLLSQLGIRGKIQDVIYKALKSEEPVIEQQPAITTAPVLTTE